MQLEHKAALPPTPLKCNILPTANFNRKASYVDSLKDKIFLDIFTLTILPPPITCFFQSSILPSNTLYYPQFSSQAYCDMSTHIQISSKIIYSFAETMSYLWLTNSLAHCPYLSYCRPMYIHLQLSM
jgi:hypothetical protein